MKHQWIVYDERAHAMGDTDRASVLVCEDSEAQALAWKGRGYVWRYDVDADGKTLVNETFVGPTRYQERHP